jgi:hypothetical protein
MCAAGGEDADARCPSASLLSQRSSSWLFPSADGRPVRGRVLRWTVEPAQAGTSSRTYAGVARSCSRKGIDRSLRPLPKTSRKPLWRSTSERDQAFPEQPGGEAARGAKEAVQIGGGRRLVGLLLPRVARVFDRRLLLQDEEAEVRDRQIRQLRLAVEAMRKLVDERQQALAVPAHRAQAMVSRPVGSVEEVEGLR